jgi:alpha-tubulin suppressor-like RCC1 family protein
VTSGATGIAAGVGDNGQLGYGNTNDIGDDELPASAGDVDVGGAVVQVSTGGHHTCALLGAGKVRCWGFGGTGALGYGNTNSIGDNELPASAGDVNVGGEVVKLAAGGSRTCALLATGSVRCWGFGGHLPGDVRPGTALGYGNTNTIGDDEPPASAGDLNIGGSVVQASANDRHTCAVLETGALRCWGEGRYGKLGYGNTRTIGDDEVPASAGDVSVGGRVVQVGLGTEHTCAVLETGSVRCWGYARDGVLGQGVTMGLEEGPFDFVWEGTPSVTMSYRVARR